MMEFLVNLQEILGRYEMAT